MPYIIGVTHTVSTYY